MANLTPTFAREEDGTVYAFFEEQVIAKGKDFKQVEESAVDYLQHLKLNRDASAKDAHIQAATHIVTPNGVKGEILGRTEGMWGEKEITVRFENGRIAKFQAHGGNDENIQYTTEAGDIPSNPIEALEQELNTEVGGDKASLTSRIASLDSIITEASNHLAQGASYSDEQALSKLVTHAEYEKGEAKSALAYLEQCDAENLGYKPPVHTAVEQADLGRAKGDSWLDHTVQAMMEETAGIDYDRLLAEEPAQFVAGLETGTLSSQGVVSEIAYSHIVSKTASFTGENVDSYRDIFVAAVEQARRAELSSRKEVAQKVAATEEDDLSRIPDDALFMGR